MTLEDRGVCHLVSVLLAPDSRFRLGEFALTQAQQPVVVERFSELSADFLVIHFIVSN